MARERDYRAEYERRQELARQRGFSGYWQQRTAPRTRRGQLDPTRLPGKAREGRRDALSVIHLARETGVSVEIAAALRGVPMQRVRWYAKDALGPTRNGRTMPTRADRMPRLRPVFVEGEDHVVFVTLRGSRAADRLADAFDVQWRYLHGDATDDEVRALAGLRAGGRRVEADPRRLDVIAALGEPNPDEVYRELVA
ncbi:MAG: hypothetical protein ACRDQZ_06660 [Mycobacteriales bacterium]